MPGANPATPVAVAAIHRLKPMLEATTHFYQGEHISMQRHIRLLLTGLAATAVLAAAVGTATAQRLVVSNQQIRAVWSSLELGNSVTSETLRCPVTLEGSFHSRTIVKTVGSLVGYVTRAAVSNAVCTGGHATILQETLPWHLTYQSFTGTLPNISSVTLNLIRAGFIIETAANNCRAVTTALRPARGIATVGAGGAVTGLRADETATIPLVNGPGGFACSLATGFFRGVGAVTLLGNTTAISITLI
jgi:hypothetical protein